MSHAWRAVNPLKTIFWCMDCGTLKTTLDVGWISPGCWPQDYESACPGKPVYSRPRTGARLEFEQSELDAFIDSAAKGKYS